MNRKISVQLDNSADAALEYLMSTNSGTISDLVNVAITALAKNEQPVLNLNHSAWGDFKVTFMNKFPDISITTWCYDKGIDLSRLRYLINRTAKGGTVWGFGNAKNKWRDRLDDREFKTHTAWIAHCIKEDFDIDIT